MEQPRELEQQVHKYETKITELQKATCKLKRRINTLSSISKLPDELLSEVFALVKDAESEENPDDAPFEWIGVTHVCNFWRNTALSTPLLWTEPSMKNLFWAHTMLERSNYNAIPFSVKATLKDKLTPDLCSGIATAFVRAFSLQHAGRLKHISITSMEPMHSGLLTLLPSSAPRLESLKIKRAPRNIDDGYVELPDYVLASAPRLMRIELEDVYFTLHSHLFNNLSHLTLRRIYDWKEHGSTPFFDLLHRLAPQLLSLNLYDAFPSYMTEHNVNAMTPIRFARLTTLNVASVDGDTAELEVLFRVIKIPSRAAVNISLGFWRRSETQWSTLLPLVASSYSPSLSAVKFKTLSISHEESEKFFRLELRPNPVGESRSASIHICAPLWSHNPEDFKRGEKIERIESALYSALDSTVNLHYIAQVNLRNNAMEIPTLRRTIGTLPSLSFIRLHGYQRICGALTVALLDTNVSLQAPESISMIMVFPQLKAIAFDSIPLKPFEPAPVSIPWDTALDNLEVCLDLRAKCGVAIKRLFFSRCRGLEKTGTLRLNNLADEVHWK